MHQHRCMGGWEWCSPCLFVIPCQRYTDHEEYNCKSNAKSNIPGAHSSLRNPVFFDIA